MLRMAYLDNVYTTVARLSGMKGAQIHALTNSERRMIKSLLDMGVQL